MKLVVLDGHTLNPGDLDWSELRSICDVEIFERSTPAETVSRVQGADGVLTNKALLGRETLAQLPNLKFIGVTATGFNIVDVVAAREQEITVSNVPAYSTASVAQLTFALLLELTHHVGLHSDTVRAGEWAASKDFAYWHTPLTELEGLTLGVFGMGNIGARVAVIASAFGMKVIALRRPSSLPGVVELVDSEDEFLARCDALSLHAPLTDATKNWINAERLSKMKPSAYLVNTSRGALIDEAALADALNAGQLTGAGLDVLSVEPPPASNPLLTAKNCVITPHIAWASFAARKRLYSVTLDNVRAFVAGAPQNVVP